MCPTFDKPEQGLDLLQEAITNCGLTAGEDFFIGLNCAGHEIFDYVSYKLSFCFLFKNFICKIH
jgi:enolase